MTQDRDLRQTLLDYIAALGAKDLAAIERLASAHGLVEIPFLKPNRLVGKREIVKAHGDIFARLERVEFVAEQILGDAGHAIAEGVLQVERGAQTRRYPAGLVVAAGTDQPGRISLYCDARYSRLWSDRSIL